MNGRFRPYTYARLPEILLASTLGYLIWTLIGDLVVWIQVTYLHTLFQLRFQTEILALGIGVGVGVILLWIFRRLRLPVLTSLAIVGAILIISHLGFHRLFSPYATGPDIFLVKPNWSIQGMQITISGYDFGKVIDPGSVMVGSIPFIIEQWNEHEIVVSQPLVDDYGTYPMIVCTRENRCATYENFTVRDPSTL